MGKTLSLTPRQEAFAHNVANIELSRATGESATQKQAAIDAGYAESGAESNASKLTSSDKLRNRINEIKQQGIKKADLTTDILVADLASIATNKEAAENARVSAHKVLLQVNGDLIQKHEDVTQHMSDEELIEARAAEIMDILPNQDMDTLKQAIRDKLNS